MEHELTFEQINDHIQKADLKQFQQGAAKHFTAAEAAAKPGDVLQKVCGIYHVVRPILQGVLLIPFIPGPWKEALRTFMNLMNTLCP